ncbi:glomulin [Culicoides brevitarsis]|uniref:glomulin n=1 Tax=Culicoides brevitarsis TaxID=469753 RepID=UPI00307B6681
MSFEIVKIVQEHLEKNELLAATELIKAQTSESLHLVCSELVNIAAEHLTRDNYAKNVEKYLACENLLRLIAAQAVKEDALFELLEVLEGVDHDEKFTSVLKALQTVLLRMDHNKSQAIAWVLDSVVQYLEREIKMPDMLKGQVGAEMEKLIENDPTVERLLQLYLTIFLFLEPVQRCLLTQTHDATQIFFNQDFNSRNVMTTFLLKLMEGTFAHLNFDLGAKGFKSYSRQRAENLMELLGKIYPNIFKLFEVMDDRHFVKNLPQKPSNKTDFKNIFYSEERFTELSVAMAFYLTFVEKIFLPLPQIYRNEYKIDKGLLLVNHFLNTTFPQLQKKGIALGLELVNLASDSSLKDGDIDSDTRNAFFDLLTKVVVFSSDEQNRKNGMKLFDLYVSKHILTEKYKIIDHLFNTTSHSGLLSHTTMIYKGIVLQLLNSGDLSNFSSAKFCNILKTYVCRLKDGEKTDLMESHELLMTALNLLIFLMMRDKDNCTGIFNVIDELQKSFLEPLEKALQLSRAHYANETNLVEKGEEQKAEKMEIDIQNDAEDTQLEITKEKKLEILTYATNMFDIMSRLLARVQECVDLKNKK